MWPEQEPTGLGKQLQLVHTSQIQYINFCIGMDHLIHLAQVLQQQKAEHGQQVQITENYIAILLAHMQMRLLIILVILLKVIILYIEIPEELIFMLIVY